MKFATLIDAPFKGFKEGKVFPVEVADMFWMRPEEKGGLVVVLGMMNYLRITNPDGTPTQYYSLFTYSDEGQ